ncbi:2-iminoacetate synthase ThiH [bacterium]|nr:2-iminoacetate synthase ThiH [bacterium]
MNFYEQIHSMYSNAIRERVKNANAADVERALGREHLEIADFAALVSPAAAPYIEEIARRSAAITERRFGRVIQLYAPLYVSNECVNKCVYCGFSHEVGIPRLTLTIEQAIAEADAIASLGFRHILLVSGEDRRYVTVPYLTEIVRNLNNKFAAISIEIQPMSEDEYRELVAAGVDGLAIYQETYDEALYKTLHPAGPKRNYKNRLDAIEAGGRAGMHSLGIGALLGLGDWRNEAVMVAMHGRYLARKFWRSRVAVSFPRIRGSAHKFQPKSLPTDADLVQMICAMRLALPDAELVMSTRENARLRDSLIGLGITRTSAGSKTNPGGYEMDEASGPKGGEQFAVSDPRKPAEVAAAIAAKGYEPVWKDFDRTLAKC